MNRLGRLVASGLVLAGLVLGAAGPAVAMHTEESFNATLGEATQVEIDRQWVDEAGMTRIRGQRMTREISGEVSGSEEVVASLNLDEATGDGLVWGSTMITLERDGREGRFRSRFFGTITDGLVEGWVYGLGLDGFEGTRLHAEFSDVDSPGEMTLEGVVIE